MKVVHDIRGLNAQGALTVNLSLWNQVQDFDRRRLEEELYEKPTIDDFKIIEGKREPLQFTLNGKPFRKNL